MKHINLLLITTDQQRGDCLGCDGHPVLETPYLDELAERGARFRHAYTSVPSCTPSRAAILTGMDQWNHGRLHMTGTDALEYGMQYVTDGREKYIWFHHTGREQFFNLDDDPLECRELSTDAKYQERIVLWRQRLADINERRGDPRGKDGKLVPQPGGALTLSPNYEKWKHRAATMRMA
jgi:hypothetical protein